jgi:glycosyltransferase involved in cell wall biosynthesis
VNRRPTVTVVMTSYNYARFLERAIASVVEQTRDGWKMVIVDDCSTDGSWGWLTAGGAGMIALRPSRTRSVWGLWVH